jgi:hypothetical protein
MSVRETRDADWAETNMWRLFSFCGTLRLYPPPLLVFSHEYKTA